MKTLTFLCLCGCFLILTTVDLPTHTGQAPHTPAIPTPADMIPAMPRSPLIQQSVHGTPVHFDPFDTIRLDEEEHNDFEFGISVQELNLHLVNQRTGDRLI